MGVIELFERFHGKPEQEILMVELRLEEVREESTCDRVPEEDGGEVQEQRRQWRGW